MSATPLTADITAGIPSDSRLSNASAVVLAVGGWIGVITILGGASALTVAGALLVFGPAFMSHI